MAFPVVESVTASGSVTGGAAVLGSTAATSHAVTLPLTVSAGATLIVVGRITVAGTVAVTGGGWTIVQDDTDASDDVSFWMYKSTAAVGNEDATTITVTHGSGKMVAIAMSITGATDPAVTPPQVSTVAVGTGSNPGPTVCTPTGGAKDYLWIAVGLADGEHTAPPGTIPASYGSSNGSSTGTAGAVGTNATTYIATRDLNAASEDAGTWTTSVAVANGWTSWALAVHPDPTETTVAQISLAPGSVPVTRTGHSLKVRARTTSGAGTIKAALYEGASNRSGNLESTALTTSLADYTLAISDGNAATITSYADLEIRLWGYALSGGAIVFEVDQIWLETPVASGAVPRYGFVQFQNPGIA